MRIFSLFLSLSFSFSPRERTFLSPYNSAPSARVTFVRACTRICMWVTSLKALSPLMHLRRGILGRGGEGRRWRQCRIYGAWRIDGEITPMNWYIEKRYAARHTMRLKAWISSHVDDFKEMCVKYLFAHQYVLLFLRYLVYYRIKICTCSMSFYLYVYIYICTTKLFIQNAKM